MPRWTENGSETLRQIIEASEREVRVSVVINSEKYIRLSRMDWSAPVLRYLNTMEESPGTWSSLERIPRVY